MSTTAVVNFLVKFDVESVLGQPLLEVTTMARFRPARLRRMTAVTALQCARLVSSASPGPLIYRVHKTALLVGRATPDLGVHEALALLVPAP